MESEPKSVSGENSGKGFCRSKLTLRFLSPVEEEAFKRHRTQKMLGNLSSLLLILAAVVLPGFVMRLQEVPSEWDGMVIVIRVCTSGLAVTVGPLLAVMMRVPKFQEFIDFHTCEIFVAVLMIALAIREDNTSNN
jgi:hypothetical protein